MLQQIRGAGDEAVVKAENGKLKMVKTVKHEL
jgi:hypothetical protein